MKCTQYDSIIIYRVKANVHNSLIMIYWTLTICTSPECYYRIIIIHIIIQYRRQLRWLCKDQYYIYSYNDVQNVVNYYTILYIYTQTYWFLFADCTCVHCTGSNWLGGVTGRIWLPSKQKVKYKYKLTIEAFIIL